MIEAIIKHLKEKGCEVGLCGSKVTCDPAPTETDTDYLVLSCTKDQMKEIFHYLVEKGFFWEGDEHYAEQGITNFFSMRWCDFNIILTGNPDFAHRHRTATAICKKLNLLKKEDRVMVFQGVLYGNYKTEPEIDERDIF